MATVAASCCRKALTSRMPRPLVLARSNVGGNPIPSSRTETRIVSTSRTKLTRANYHTRPSALGRAAKSVGRRCRRTRRTPRGRVILRQYRRVLATDSGAESRSAVCLCIPFDMGRRHTPLARVSRRQNTPRPGSNASPYPVRRGLCADHPQS